MITPLEKGGESPDRRLAAVLGTVGRERLPSNVIPFPGAHRPETTPASVSRPRSTASVYQLKVTLQNIKPPVWRRVLVDAASTHPEHRELAEWIGRPFDPEAFDPDDFADNLREGRLAALDD